MAVATMESTQVRLLDAAETLVGERGVDGVSLRAINTEAGSKVADAHYHFGSKERLVRAVLDRRMSVLGEERLRQVDALTEGATPPPRAIAAVFVGPLFDFAATPEGRRYVRFLDALHRAGGKWLAVLDAAFAPQWAQLEPLLSRALPDLDP